MNIKNNSSKFPSGNISLLVAEKDKIRHGVIKRFGRPLKVNTDKNSYCDLADDIDEYLAKFSRHFGSLAIQIGTAFLRDFFTVDQKTSFRKVNVDILSIYAFGEKWLDVNITRTIYYVIYHYRPNYRKYRKTLLIRSGNNIELIYKRDTREDFIFSGTWENAGNNTFISLKSNNGLKASQFITLYTESGWGENTKYYLGILSGASSDGTPFAYKIVLERHSDESAAILEIKSKEVSKNISRYIYDSFIWGAKEVPSSTNEIFIIKDPIIENYAGEYKLFTSGREGSIYDPIYEDKIIIDKEGSCIFTNNYIDKNFFGEVYFRDGKTMEICINDYNKNGEKCGVYKFFLIHISPYGIRQLYFPGICLTVDSELRPIAQPALLTPRLDINKKHQVIEKYFAEFNPTRYMSLNLYDIERIRREAGDNI